MSKSNPPKVNKASQEQGEALIRQLQQRFAGFWRRLIAPLEPAEAPGEDNGYIEEYLGNLKERAYLERTIANQYRGRYLLELIQNAVDNMHKQAAETGRKPGRTKIKDIEEEATAYRCQIELTPTTLFVANDGLGFDEADVRGLCAMGQSTKPAGEYIGYKGLGFRAVLEITDTPEIYSGSYRFGFSRAETLALLATPGAPANLDRVEVPVLAVPHLRSGEDLPQDDKEILARLKKAGYATVVRLPLKHPQETYYDVKAACQELLSSQTLLFLPYITELSVAIADRKGEQTQVTIAATRREMAVRPASLMEQVKVTRLTFRRSEISGPANPKKPGELKQAPAVQEDWLLVAGREPLEIDSPELVANLEDPTWREVRRINRAVAFPLARLPRGGDEVFPKRRNAPLPFFAHFPTQEGSGLGLAVHADFYLTASRKQIEWSVPYNQWLAHKLVSFICGPALDAAHYLFPDDAALVETLLDYPYYNDRFGRSFREALDAKLANSAFIPVGNNLYMPPNRVVWTPLEQEGVLIFRRVFRYPGKELYYPVLQLEEIHARPEMEVKPSSKTLKDDYEFEAGRDPATLPDYEADHSPLYYDADKYERDPYSGQGYDDSRYYDADKYERDPYSPGGYDDAPETINHSRIDSKVQAEEFDYKRIRRFLSELGVKKLWPAQLPLIYDQALQGWENGMVFTGEICAALALWYAELAREEAGVGQGRRRLLEQAQTLPVLPTVTEGWQAPENRRFVFAELPQPEPIYRSGENTFIYDHPTPPEAIEPARPVVYIRPDAYDMEEFAPQIHEWHRVLGVRTGKDDFK